MSRIWLTLTLSGCLALFGDGDPVEDTATPFTMSEYAAAFETAACEAADRCGVVVEPRCADEASRQLGAEQDCYESVACDFDAGNARDCLALIEGAPCDGYGLQTAFALCEQAWICPFDQTGTLSTCLSEIAR
jgi:hypothetical protein